MSIFEKLPDISNIYKGKIELELIDDLTGKVVEKVEKENTLTELGKNYLLWAFKEPLYRWFPGWTTSTRGFGSQIQAGKEPFYPFEYVVLTDHADPIDPIIDNEVKGNIVAFAVKGEYVGSDPKRGRMDSAETKEIPNGIQYAFLWNTYQGNGPINSVYWATLDPKKWYDLYDVVNMGVSVPNPTSANIKYNVLVKSDIIKTVKIGSSNIYDLVPLVLNGITYYYACANDRYIGRFDENLNSLSNESSLDSGTFNDTFTSLAAHNGKLYAYNTYSSYNRIVRFAPNPSTGALAGTKEKTWNVPSGVQGPILIKDNVLYHLRNDKKVYAFNLAAIDSKPDMQNANADVVYDLSSILANTNYYGFNYDPVRDSILIIAGPDLYEFSADFTLKNRSTIVPQIGADSFNNRGLVIYNNKLYYLNNQGQLREFIWGCAGARVLLPQTIYKDDTNLLKLTYTFTFTS